MSIKVIEYDLKSGQEVRVLGDGFSGTVDANNCAYSKHIPSNHFYKLERSDTPVMRSYEENNEQDCSRGDFSFPRSEPRKYEVFWEGWIILVLLAIAIFIALKWQAMGGAL